MASTIHAVSLSIKRKKGKEASQVGRDFGVYDMTKQVDEVPTGMCNRIKAGGPKNERVSVHIPSDM